MHQPFDARSTRVRLWTLWVLVSALWTSGTLLRVNRVWVPLVGWHRCMASPWLWISLLAPPLLFALMLGAARRSMLADPADRQRHNYMI